jgi:predicted metal-binding membrane protein
MVHSLRVTVARARPPGFQITGEAFDVSAAGLEQADVALVAPGGVLPQVQGGVVVIAAGVYEVAPLKRHFRRRCRDGVRSGFRVGLCCAGSSAGLMVMLVALGVMSITWMAVIAVLVLAQKLLPAIAAVDVPLALAIAGLGVLIVITPSLVPGLSPPMGAVTGVAGQATLL